MNTLANNAKLIDEIVKRMFTTIRARVAYHPDQIIETRRQIPSAEKLIGLTRAEFAQFISSQFQEQGPPEAPRMVMTFFNWGRGEKTWQIDHIIALSMYDVRDIQQVLRASHYTNLQPLWTCENMEKYNYLPTSLSPLLAIQLAYNDNIPGNFDHLPTYEVLPHLPGLFLPIHDSYTEFRIRYAFVDRDKRRNIEDCQAIYIKST